jgi:C_GCAxxG_C_C family probable redox protein
MTLVLGKGRRKMSDKVEIAVDKFTSGYNCAQSVLYPFCDDLSLEKNTALKLACGFGAGMGRKEEVCGAVTGGIIVIGLKYGRGLADDRSVTEQSYKLTRELMMRFEEKHGSYICLKLLNNCNLLTGEGQKYFKDNDLLNKTCKECVRSVVQILKDIL